jgi:imidazolonepropionase-like amidohydrolase
MVGRMQRAGVGLLAGSDAPQSYLAPGLALHDELTALVRDAGLTPLEALRAATINPARYLGAADSRGAVRDGFVADLVVLEGDPVRDIEALRRIRAVIVGGRLYDRPRLDAMLADVERTVRAGTPR